MMVLQHLLKSKGKCILPTYKKVTFIPVNTFTYQRLIGRLYDDGINVKQQTIEINSVERIHRCSLHKNDDIWTLYKTKHPNVETLGDALHEGCTSSNNGPCVGIVQLSNNIKSLHWLSYSEVIEKSQRIGSYLWIKTKLTPMKSKVAIISENRPEYLFVEHACYQYGFIIISLYTTYDSTAILHVLQVTQAEVLIVDDIKRIKAIEDQLLNHSQIKEIIVLDDICSDEKNKIRSISTTLKSIYTHDIHQRPYVDPNNIATLILTSGTTGRSR